MGIILNTALDLASNFTSPAYEQAHRYLVSAFNREAVEVDISARGLSRIPVSVGRLVDCRTLLVHSNRLRKLPLSFGTIEPVKILQSPLFRNENRCVCTAMAWMLIVRPVLCSAVP